ncbi:Rap1a/Tai family immunity protein [Pseudomonas syringae]|uniref:Rap1a/Tai family immunity protein n=1 Tax=Pseudomonas syringae TaxID=317 RepID=UPI0011D04F12|nr:Rap1a/Tai family immunity protein [Pseudomonas syringae]
MKIFATAIVLAGTVLCAQLAKAETGTEMAGHCRAFLNEKPDPDQSFGAGVCAGLVYGVTDTLKTAHIASPEAVSVCIPIEGFTMGQAAQILLKYLDDHPETLNNNASVLAIKAFRKAYPCK